MEFPMARKRKWRWFGADLTCALESGKVKIEQLSKKIKKRNRFVRPKLPIINLEATHISTEKELIWLIYNNWGSGTYMIMAFLGGKRGFTVFWMGKIDKDGFIFINNEKKKKEIKKIKQDMLFEVYQDKKNSDSSDINKAMLEEIRNDMRNEEKKRYGFKPFLKPSGKRGTFVFWKTEVMTQVKEEWGDVNSNKVKQEDWGITAAPKFEKW